MPNPTQSDLHVNVPLTNVSLSWKQDSDAFICDKIFPKVPVKHQSNIYWKMGKAAWRRTDVKKRAPGTESPGVGWTATTDSYFAEVYAQRALATGCLYGTSTVLGTFRPSRSMAQ